MNKVKFSLCVVEMSFYREYSKTPLKIKLNIQFQ